MLLFFHLLAFHGAHRSHTLSALRMAAYRIALNQIKATEQYRMPSVGHSETVAEGYTLLTLQNHVLERIFLRLHLTDLARCCQVCKDLQSLVQQDSVWQSLCSTAFPVFTASELKQWIKPTVQPDGWQRASEAAREPPLSSLVPSLSGLLPTSYRQLYPILKQLEPLIGIWKHDKKSGKPVLYVFYWGTQCVWGRKLCYDLPGQEPFVEPFHQVGPGTSASVQHVDSTHCLLTVQTGTPRSPITKAVQAATAVAVGGIPIPKRDQSHDIMGTSPEGSFEYEMQRFMQGNIAEKKQGKRRRSGPRSSSGATPQAPSLAEVLCYHCYMTGALCKAQHGEKPIKHCDSKQSTSTLPVIHTLTRVDQPTPTQRHPLAGVWRTTGMLHSCIMVVRYDFSSQAATVAATQVQCVDSFLQGWNARAHPVSKPWPTGFRSMLSMQADMSMLNGDFEHFDEAGTELLAGKEVVQICIGQVDAHGYISPAYLWLYADGTLGVYFDREFDLDSQRTLINMQRIDSDLQLQH